MRPPILPSFEVHISRSVALGTHASSGPDFWVRRGFPLRAVIAEVYGMDAGRVFLPQTPNAEETFEFAVVLPEALGRFEIHAMVQAAIEARFGVSAVRERKDLEVFVLTCVPGWEFRESQEGWGGSSGSSSVLFAAPEGMRTGLSSISARGSTAEEFRAQLELGLGRPVVDETGLAGTYDFGAEGSARSGDEFVLMLQEQSGLVLTAGVRSIEVLTLMP